MSEFSLRLQLPPKDFHIMLQLNESQRISQYEVEWLGFRFYVNEKAYMQFHIENNYMHISDESKDRILATLEKMCP